MQPTAKQTPLEARPIGITIPPAAEVMVGDPRLTISVLFTSIEATRFALRSAANLARRLGARITLLVPEVVSYQLPLNSPPILHDWNSKRLRAMAEKSPVETNVKFYLCRDLDETLARVLQPQSLVVMGEKRSWLPTFESRLARRLRRMGHEVVLTEME